MTDFKEVKVCLVAAPLTARSGVYRSARELVDEARRQGYSWSLVLGVSKTARGAAPAEDPPWITEFAVEPSGPRGIFQLKSLLLAQSNISESDVAVSLIPQSDMALALGSHSWVSYLRGLPWPDRGEASGAKRLIWQILERVALRRASAVWATTPLLKQHAALNQPVRIVPPGLKQTGRQWDGRGERNRIVWAARFDADKNPMLFLESMRGLPLEGVMYGSGPMEQLLREHAPSNVTVSGWSDPEHLWDGALAYAGTSHREAFGRSAVEAAMAGVPTVISRHFGAADFLVTDDGLKKLLVLPTDALQQWRSTFMLLAKDEITRVRTSDHVNENASQLTVGRSVDSIRGALGSQ